MHREIDEPDFEKLEQKYRFPDGSWNWRAMTLEEYRRVDRYDARNFIASVGNDYPTQYMSVNLRLRNELWQRDKTDTEPRVMTTYEYAHIIGYSSGVRPSTRRIMAMEAIGFKSRYPRVRLRRR